MTRDVVTVKRETLLLDVAKLMADKGLAGVPVIEEDGKVAGIIAERDFLVRMGALDTKSFMGVVEKMPGGEKLRCSTHTGPKSGRSHDLAGRNRAGGNNFTGYFMPGVFSFFQCRSVR